MGFGDVVRAAIYGGARARGAYLGAKNEASAITREREIEERERMRDAVRRSMGIAVDRERLGETRRHNQAMEATAQQRADASAKRAAASRSETSKPTQWQVVASKAAKYRQDGLPEDIASIKARLEVGAGVSPDEAADYRSFTRDPDAYRRRYGPRPSAGSTRGKDFQNVRSGSSTSSPGNIDLRK